MSQLKVNVIACKGCHRLLGLKEGARQLRCPHPDCGSTTSRVMGQGVLSSMTVQPSVLAVDENVLNAKRFAWHPDDAPPAPQPPAVNESIIVLCDVEIDDGQEVTGDEEAPMGFALVRLGTALESPVAQIFDDGRVVLVPSDSPFHLLIDHVVLGRQRELPGYQSRELVSV